MERFWHSLDQYNNPNTAGSFTVLTYNILAEKYATTQMYGYVPSWALIWEYRKQMILHEILSYDADIICLQVRTRCFSIGKCFELFHLSLSL